MPNKVKLHISFNQPNVCFLITKNELRFTTLDSRRKLPSQSTLDKKLAIVSIESRLYLNIIETNIIMEK